MSKPAQMNPEDVQMIEARKFGIEEIARAYRIPPPLLQDLTNEDRKPNRGHN